MATANDESYDAQKTEKYATAAISWTGPLILFGWAILIVAAVVFLFTLFLAVLAIVNGNDNVGIIGLAVGSSLIAAASAIVLVLQAALILAVAYYLRMRAHWTRHEAKAALRP